MPFDDLTPDLASSVLARLGAQVQPRELSIERRSERWLVRLPERRVAWFAASERGALKLAMERRVLDLLRDCCTFQVPRTLRGDSTAGVELRTMVPGVDDPWPLYARVRSDPRLAKRLGTGLGAILAQQHTRIGSRDVADWLPRKLAWPEPSEWIVERIPKVVADQNLLTNAELVLRHYDELRVAESERVLVHSDVGLHNLGIDASSDAVLGLYDFEEAAWADRHHDFRYLLLDTDRNELLDAAIAVYQPATGHRISRGRVALYNAVCALSFLAFRMGTPPEARSCGRTLASDLHWSRHAIQRALEDLEGV